MSDIKRRDFIRLSLLSASGIYLYPNLAMAYPANEYTPLLIKEYSINSCSLTLSRLLLNKTGKTPLELSINPTKYDTEKGIDTVFTHKVNEIDAKITSNYDSYSIKQNPQLSDEEFQKSLDDIKSIAIAGSVGIGLGAAYLFNPLLGKFLTTAIGGGIVYDVVKDLFGTDNKNTLKPDVDYSKLNNSIKNLKTEVTNTYNSIEKNSKETENSLSLLQNQINNQNKGLQSLITNQNKSLKDLISQQFSNNTAQLNKIGNNISVLNNKLNSANTQLNIINSKIDFTNNNIIKSSQKVIEVVGGKVDTLSKYVWLNLPPELQMQALNDNELAFIKDLETKGELELTKQNLQKVIDSKEFESWYNDLKSKFNSTNKIIGETYKAALVLGLKGKDAERAGRVVKWAEQATSMALSFAMGNPIGTITGVMQSINFLGGLLGGKPKEDPVLKALKQISEQLNGIHNDMINGFSHLDKKLDDLADLNIKLYENLISAIAHQTKLQQEWFTHISKKLDVLKSNQELILKKIDDITVFVINEREKDISILDKFEENRIKEHGIYFDKYDDFIIVYKNVKFFSSGLEALNSIITNISSKNNLSYFSVVTERYKENPSLAYFESTELYNPSKLLFDTFYGNKQFYQIALNSLLLPTSKLNDNNKTYNLSKKLGTYNEYQSITNLNSTYLSPYAIARISRLYMVYCHFDEIQKNSNTLEPGSIAFYLNLDKSSKQIRVKEMTKKIESLIHITNQSLAQQAIMSGHLLFTQIENVLFNGLKLSLKNKVKRILSSNYILANNFVKYLLYSKLDPSISKVNIDKYNTAYTQKSIYSISKLIGFDVKLDSKDKLKIKLTSGLELYLPNGEEIIKNDMLYTSDMELLLATKQKLIQKKIDLEFGFVFS